MAVRSYTDRKKGTTGPFLNQKNSQSPFSYDFTFTLPLLFPFEGTREQRAWIARM
jgi:hypothetical protein